MFAGFCRKAQKNCNLLLKATVLIFYFRKSFFNPAPSYEENRNERY